MFRRFLLAIFVVILIGCGEDKTAVVEPEPTPNKPPVIDRVILPNQIEANTPLKLQVITRDADKDKLSIVWEASEGTVADDVWTPPNRATQVVISVHVTDGKNPTVTQSKNVNVTKPKTADPLPQPLPPPQRESEPSPPQPEPEPLLPEPEVGEAWNIIGKVGIEHVTPGQEPLKISIDDTVQQVNAVAEQGRWSGDNTQILFHPRLGNFICFYENGRTIGITVTNARYKTAEGISVGSHLNDVVAEYGQPDTIDRAEQLTFHNYFHSGYIFSFAANERVIAITVRR